MKVTNKPGPGQKIKTIFLLFLMPLLLIGCASKGFVVQEPSVRYTIPFEWPTRQKLSKYKGIVYEGMSLQGVYRAFDKALEKSHRKEGNEEWITFINWTTEEPADLVTFYLLDGKIKGWEEKRPEFSK